MKAFSNFLGLVFGLALLVALLAGGYFLFKYAANVFNILEPQVKAITAIASVVALLCASIIAGGLKARSPKDIVSSRSVDRAKVYQRLLSICTGQLKRPIGGKEWIADDEQTGIEQLLALHGSPKVINAYMSLRRLAVQEVKSGDEMPVLLNRLVMEMRADLGSTDSNLKEDDLLDLLGCHD